MKKHGFENHKFEILRFCEKSELNFWEIFYIKLFETFDSEHGLNCTSGGNAPERKKGETKLEEWKIKISESHKGKKREEFSQEWKNNLRNSHKGIKRNENWLENLKKSAKKRKEENRYVISEEQKSKQKKSLSNFFKSTNGIEKKNCRKYKIKIF